MFRIVVLILCAAGIGRTLASSGSIPRLRDIQTIHRTTTETPTTTTPTTTTTVTSTTTAPPTTGSHHGHHNSEPNESESLMFLYDAASHYMGVKSGKTSCYLYQTTPEQQAAIHTSRGLHAVEKLLIDLIDLGLTTGTLSRADVSAISSKLSHHCAHTQTIYQLHA